MHVRMSAMRILLPCLLVAWIGCTKHSHKTEEPDAAVPLRDHSAGKLVSATRIARVGAARASCTSARP